MQRICTLPWTRLLIIFYACAMCLQCESRAFKWTLLVKSNTRRNTRRNLTRIRVFVRFVNNADYNNIKPPKQNHISYFSQSVPNTIIMSTISFNVVKSFSCFNKTNIQQFSVDIGITWPLFFYFHLKDERKNKSYRSKYIEIVDFRKYVANWITHCISGFNKIKYLF